MRTGQMSSRRGQTSNQPCELEALHCLSQLSRTPTNMGRYVASLNPYTSLPSKCQSFRVFRMIGKMSLLVLFTAVSWQCLLHYYQEYQQAKQATALDLMTDQAGLLASLAGLSLVIWIYFKLKVSLSRVMTVCNDCHDFLEQ